MENLKKIFFLLFILLLITGCGKNSNDNFILNEPLEEEKSDFDAVFDDFTSTVEDMRIEKEIKEYSINKKDSDIPLNVSNFTNEDLGLIVDFIDVGYGDAILISSNGEYALIDSGNTYSSEKLNEFISSKTSTLKYFISTNINEEHLGGSFNILKTFNIENIIRKTEEKENNTSRKLISSAEKFNINIIEPIDKQEYKIGDAYFIIFNTSSDVDETNLVVKLIYKDTSFLFMSDCTNFDENALIESNFDISANVLKVGNHGKQKSTSSLFLDRVKPSLAIISVDANINGDYPHKDVLSKLNDRNILTYRTDVHGIISVGSDGTNIYAIPQTAGEEISNVKDDFVPEKIVEEDNSSDVIFYPEDMDTLIVYSTRDNKYHSNGCLQLKKVFTQINLGIAKEKGLVPCENCKPPKYK